MQNKKIKAVNKKVSSIEIWRENEIVKCLLLKKENGNAYMYSYAEIQKHFDITYNHLKDICRKHSIIR